ncbi:hypothetical protein [Methylobacter psychrophilus]|uniref:hypothetical protein n=1 Tax=Methylobacter psychrophilus TaxID=96941 RepID=UPI0021D4B5B6|nr:hypothetical protein [Methylobacter psychrophilus]
MPFPMKHFVFWSGVYNAGLALFLLCPPLYRGIGMNICDPVWGWLIAGFLGFSSAVLLLASRDLYRRATFVYWEALLRYIAALVLIPAGLFGDVGLITVPLGLGDLAIGLVYMFGLPKELGLSHHALLYDRVD